MRRLVLAAIGLFGVQPCHASALIARPSRLFTCDGSGRAGAGAGIYRTAFNGVPAIVRAPAVVLKPPIVLWHGYNSPGSEVELMRALPLDDVPALKVYVGLPLFGTRSPSPGNLSLADRQKQDFARLLFKPVVMGGGRELSKVVVALRQRRCIAPGDRIGLFGFSAGGTAALIALIRHEVPIGAAVVINAPTGLGDTVIALEHATHQPFAWSPYARRLANDSDAVKHAAQIASGFPPVALLLLNGADDEIVSAGGSRSLAAALKPFYRSDGYRARLKSEISAAVGHDWASSPQLPRLLETISSWYDRFLKTSYKFSSRGKVPPRHSSL